MLDCDWSSDVCSSDLVTTLGQLSLKAAALRGGAGKSLALAERWPQLLLLGLGYAALLGSVAISTVTLRTLEVNVVVSLTALCYPLVTAMSYAAFGERLTGRQWAGLVLVCSGVAIYNLG
jgi:drug/metabolite transporter (DMT)-like permease